MSNVTLHIGGRKFTVASAKGEEAHVAELGRMIDTKLQQMGGMSGQSETRMLLYAALLLADELHERSAVAAPDEKVGEALTELADRLENLAERLEAAVADA